MKGIGLPLLSWELVLLLFSVCKDPVFHERTVSVTWLFFSLLQVVSIMTATELAWMSPQLLIALMLYNKKRVWSSSWVPWRELLNR